MSNRQQTTDNRQQTIVCLSILVVFLDLGFSRICFGQNDPNRAPLSSDKVITTIPSKSEIEEPVESVHFKVTDASRVLSISLGVVQPKSVFRRNVLITGLRSSESEELELVRSCSCLTVEINKETNASVIILDTKLTPDGEEGLSERSIQVRRIMDGAILLTIKFEYTVRELFEVSPRFIDATDAEGKDASFVAKLYEEHSASGIEVLDAKITGPWISKSSFTNSDAGLIIKGNVSFSEQVKGGVDNEIHRVNIDFLRNNKKSSAEIAILFRRKLPLRLIKDRVLMVKENGGSSFTAKLWLKGGKGVAASDRKLEGRIEYGHTNSVAKIDQNIEFLCVSDSLWISKLSVLKEEIDRVISKPKESNVAAVLIVNGEKLPIYFTVEGADRD
jgi:hypothetical protein